MSAFHQHYFFNFNLKLFLYHLHPLFFHEGISQAAVDCFVPDVLVRKNFIKFVMDEMDILFPAEEYYRLVAHPPSLTIDSVPVRINHLKKSGGEESEARRVVDRQDVENDRSSIESKNENENENKSDIIIPQKIVIAVGPEGGWDDQEVHQLLSKGFSLVSLGPRILRTDMAVSVLLGLAHDWSDNIE